MNFLYFIFEVTLILCKIFSSYFFFSLHNKTFHNFLDLLHAKISWYQAKTLLYFIRNANNSKISTFKSKFCLLIEVEKSWWKIFFTTRSSSERMSLKSRMRMNWKCLRKKILSPFFFFFKSFAQNFLPFYVNRFFSAFSMRFFFDCAVAEFWFSLPMRPSHVAWRVFFLYAMVKEGKVYGTVYIASCVCMRDSQCTKGANPFHKSSHLIFYAIFNNPRGFYFLRTSFVLLFLAFEGS